MISPSPEASAACACVAAPRWRFSADQPCVAAAARTVATTMAEMTRLRFIRSSQGSGLEEPERLAPRAGLEGRLDAPVGDVDHVHRAVALAGDEQLVAAERHVHRLAADLDGGLRAE